MKVTLLSKYSRLGASSRLRSLQYLPALEAAGINVAVQPLFDDAYIRRLYAGEGRSPVRVAGRYAIRARDLRWSADADLLWLEYEALPYVPHWLEQALMPREVPYVVDYDDAVFHNYDLSARSWVRRLLGSKIDRVMAGAAAVICGNDYLADRARQAGAARVERLPTVVDADQYLFAPRPENSEPVIGWIGSPMTAKYLQVIAPALAAVCADGKARIRLIGSGPVDLPGVPVDVIPWSEATEVEEIRRFDVGVMPLPDTPWERGKCGFKLIQYMACGLPVVASPVGVNSEIVEEGGNGFLAANHDDWVRALTSLRDDALLRQRLGAAGRDKVERQYSLQVTGPRLAKLLAEAARSPRLGSSGR